MQAKHSKAHDRAGIVVRAVARMTGLQATTTLGGLLRLPLKLVPSDTEVRIWRGPLKGLRWISNSSNATCWIGTYEYQKQQAFEKLLKPGHVVFDLGANVGFYSLLASRLVGDSGRVVAFEPARRNILHLRRHLAINGINNCDVIEAAVSSDEGSAFFDASRSPVTGHLTQTQSTCDCQVQTVALDKLVCRGTVRKPNLIKCDIEGAEYEALCGARETLRVCRPTILLATHGSEVQERCCQLLQELQYRIECQKGEVTTSRTDELIAYPLT